MITVHAQYQARFREITRIASESFELQHPLMSELATTIVDKYGPLMDSLLIDRVANELNTKGTLYLNSKGRRMYMDDSLTDGETVAFMVGIAGG
jgi:molybdopterin converting factor small subunit